MASYVQQNNSRRMGVLVGIIVFHLLMLYGLVSGLARNVIEVVAAPLLTDMIEELKPEDKPPPKVWRDEYRPAPYRRPHEVAEVAQSIRLKEEDT